VIVTGTPTLTRNDGASATTLAVRCTSAPQFTTRSRLPKHPRSGDLGVQSSTLLDRGWRRYVAKLAAATATIPRTLEIDGMRSSTADRHSCHLVNDTGAPRRTYHLDSALCGTGDPTPLVDFQSTASRIAGTATPIQRRLVFTPRSCPMAIIRLCRRTASEWTSRIHSSSALEPNGRLLHRSRGAVQSGFS